MREVKTDRKHSSGEGLVPADRAEAAHMHMAHHSSAEPHPAAHRRCDRGRPEDKQLVDDRAATLSECSWDTQDTAGSIAPIPLCTRATRLDGARAQGLSKGGTRAQRRQSQPKHIASSDMGPAHVRALRILGACCTLLSVLAAADEE